MTKTQQQRRQQWQQWIAEYRASGLCASEWCASRGVNPDRLWYWLRRFRTEEESGSTKWLPVDLSGVATKGQPEGGCLVVRVGKAAVEVRPGFDPELLLAVVRSPSISSLQGGGHLTLTPGAFPL